MHAVQILYWTSSEVRGATSWSQLTRYENAKSKRKYAFSRTFTSAEKTLTRQEFQSQGGQEGPLCWPSPSAKPVEHCTCVPETTSPELSSALHKSNGVIQWTVLLETRYSSSLSARLCLGEHTIWAGHICAWPWQIHMTNMILLKLCLYPLKIKHNLSSTSSCDANHLCA